MSNDRLKPAPRRPRGRPDAIDKAPKVDHTTTETIQEVVEDTLEAVRDTGKKVEP